jgi:Tol biopolymer transport system component
MVARFKTISLSFFAACSASLLLTACSVAQNAQTRARGEQSRVPQLFAEGVINTDADEYGPAFAPDGNTIYFTRRVNRRDSEFIVFSRLINNRWTPSQVAEFSGQYFDKEPFISPDGRRLFFASRRPAAPGAQPNAARDFDIWMVERTRGGWSAPIRLGAEINTPNYENYPAVAANGNLYFASVREGGRGANDLYRARFINGRYMHAENLGDALNTSGSDADPYIAPDESYIIFSSDRTGGLGEGDLYISYNEGGRWTEPQTLGTIVNTSSYEYTPLVSRDRRYLFFSRGWGEIYRIEMSALNLRRR